MFIYMFRHIVIINTYKWFCILFMLTMNIVENYCIFKQ